MTAPTYIENQDAISLVAVCDAGGLLRAEMAKAVPFCKTLPRGLGNPVYIPPRAPADMLYQLQRWNQSPVGTHPSIIDVSVPIRPTRIIYRNVHSTVPDVANHRARALYSHVMDINQPST